MAHHLRGALARPRGAAPDDRALARHARRRASRASRCSGRSWPTPRSSSAGSQPVARRARPLAPDPRRRALEVGTPVLREGAGAVRAHRGRARRPLRGRPRTRARCSRSRTSTTLHGRRAAASSTSRPTRPSATTGTTTGPSIGEHVSEPVRGGTIQRVLLRVRQPRQDNRLSDSTGDRPVDLPADEPAIGAGNPGAGPLRDAAHASVRARDRRGRATPTARRASAATSSGLITGLALRRRRTTDELRRQPHRRRLEHPGPGRPDDRRLAGRREPEGRALMSRLPFSEILGQRPGHRHALSPFAAGADRGRPVRRRRRTSPTRRPTRSPTRTS